MVNSIKFYFLVLIGSIKPSGELHEGSKLYNIIEKDGVIEYAHKGEVLQYIETGVFVYDDFLFNCGE